MLKPKCQSWTWVKALVTSCQYAPSSTPGRHTPTALLVQVSADVTPGK